MIIQEAALNLIKRNVYPRIPDRLIEAFVDASFEYSAQNKLILTAERGDEQLFPLLRPTHQKSAVLARALYGKPMELFRVFFYDKDIPFAEQRHGVSFCSRYPDIEAALPKLYAASGVGWTCPDIQSEKLPPALDEGFVRTRIENAYRRYVDRPYHPETFGLPDALCIDRLVRLVLEGYLIELGCSDVMEFSRGRFVFDVGLLNVNREILYLIYSPEAETLDFCTYRRASIDYPNEDRRMKKCMDALNGFDKNNSLGYPLMKRWAYIDREKYEWLRLTMLNERWAPGGGTPDPVAEERAIERYIENTFVRLLWEKKVLMFNGRKEPVVSLEHATIAVFNTGLVNKTYQSIYALFKKNEKSVPIWKLDGFEVAGRGAMNGVSVLPERARYFETKEDMFYDLDISNAKYPELNFDHMLIDNFERLPEKIRENYLGSQYGDYLAAREYTRREIRANRPSNAKNTLMMLFKNALEKSVLMAEWNYRTGIPMYYIPEGEMIILLPIALESELDMLRDPEKSTTDLKIDLAVAMKRSSEGNVTKYIGKTIFTLPMAYRSARLVARPANEWLTVDMAGGGEDE
ncbi:MAG: DUF3825 domain-containing protein [Clostridiales Family XIII bacterium]|jgi:hypothetical protein|nr:DUF3825 domain-containing protein [Clostridiales Family XIII bacterium]